MWRLTLCSLLFVGGTLPLVLAEKANGSLSNHPLAPDGVDQNAWNPGVSPLGPTDGPSSDPADLGAALGERETVELELELWCVGDQLTLGVGTKPGGVELNPEALTLGKDCKGTGLSADQLWFTYNLHQCATKQSVRDGDVVYSNFLHYIPSSSDLSLKQVEAFSLPVQCTQDRLQRYARPVLMSLPVSTRSGDPGFSLRAMNGSWTGAAETNAYRRGQAVHLQAAVGQVEEEQQLYVQSCHATASPDPRSRPRVRLIVKNGCVAYVVSKRGRARFVLSERADAVNIEFAAFRFTTPEIYIHCELAVLGQSMTSASKFCNYNPKKQRWEELSGDIAVCSCCRTVCDDFTPGSDPPGPRALVSTGPLVVEDKPAAEKAEPVTSPAQLSEPPVTMETTPSPPLPVPTAFLQELQLHPSPLPLGWPELAYLDGMPVQDEGWGQPHGAPQGWLSTGAGSTRVTWVYLPVVAHGGALIVRHVPEEPVMDVVLEHVHVDPVTEAVREQAGADGKVEDSFESPQNDDGDPLWRYLRDDPSAPEVLQPLPVVDQVLEESRRKRWGGNHGVPIQEGKGPHPVREQRRPEPAYRDGDWRNPLGGVAVGDEGLVVEKTEVVMHKGRGQVNAAVLSAFRSRLALTRAEGSAQNLRYEEEEAGLAEEHRAMKRKVLLEEENVQPSSLRAVLRRMHKME